ncbi:MAG: hypothetical protein ABRQ37_10035 [Candidatus Eremiobacterota bacterium]
MSIFETVAKEFHMKQEDLLKESVRIYLIQKLYKIESEMYLILKKYGIKNILDMDSKVKEGLIKEEQAYEDYFALDNLEFDRKKIREFLEELFCKE